LTDDSLASLKVALSHGDATLIVGQDHSPDFVDAVLADANELLHPTPEWRSFPEMFATLGPDARSTVSAILGKSTPSVALLELASLPWASVFTTAIDPILADAFLNVGSQRRVVEIGPHQLSSVSSARAGHSLQIVRAFGTPSMEGPSMTPSSSAALAAARLLGLPGVLAAFQRIIGLHGHVVVAGISERDWLDQQSLSTLCHVLSVLPPGRVYWFGPTSPQVITHLAGKAHFETHSFNEQVRRWTKDERLQRDLASIRQVVFSVGERVLTIKQDNERFPLRLSSQEWRSISHVGSLLDDATIDSLDKNPSTKTELVSFLRRSHAGVPDWSGPSRGLIFERKSVRELIQAVRNYISAPKASVHGAETRGVRRVPFVLSGSPAAGKTMGLLFAAWTLRVVYHIPVLWLLPGIAGIDLVAIEKVCRLLEAKGARWIVLVLDSVELDEYFRLQRRLESEGRRVIIVGAETRLPSEPHDEPKKELERHSIAQDLNPQETRDFLAYLKKHQVPLPELAQSRDFLRLLSEAIPEVEFGAFPPLLDEYDRVIQSARAFVPERTNVSAPTSSALADQLRRLFPHFSAKIDEDVGPTSRFAADPTLRELLNITLFCAQIEQPISVDLLYLVLGSELLSKYPVFSAAFANTALIQEITLDYDGRDALSTPHQLHAMWLLRGLFPNRASQLDLLYRLAISFDWKPDAFPGEEPHQEFVLNVLRSVGPRGKYKYLYSSLESLNKLRSLIGHLRERFAVEQPKLLTLEAIILGDLAERDSENNPKSATENCQLALRLLERTEEILRERRPSEARSFELQRALTLASDIRGTLINIKLRSDEVKSSVDVDTVLDELARIEADAVRAQSYSATYHPLDIVFWSHRDALQMLPSALSPEIRVRLIETLRQALDLATEEGVEPSQLSKFNTRQVELYAIQGNSAPGADLARKMRERGDFSGEVSLTRHRLLTVTEPKKRRALIEELERLYAFRPQILRDMHAVRFLHTLWVRANIHGELGDGQPKCVKGSLEIWRMLEEISRSRLAFPDQADLSYALFFLGWALYQIDEPREATQVFSRLERQSLGNPRRVGELAYLTGADGAVRVFRAKVVFPRAGQVRISVPELDSQMMDLRPEVEARIAPGGLRLGEFVEISIALNYRGAHAQVPKRS